MKNELFRSGIRWVSFISTFILLLPLITIFIKRTTWNKSFIPFAGCFILMFCIGLINNEYINFGEEVNDVFITTSIILQAPLILLFLNYFILNPELKKAIRVSLLTYLIGGAVFLVFKPINSQTIGLLLGAGLTLVLIYSLIIFLRQIKESIHSRRETGKAFMISAIVFAYACYLFIYLMTYIFNSTEKKEIIMLFQLATIVSTLLVSFGLLIDITRPTLIPEEKKIKKLPMLTEWEEYTSGNN